MDIFLSIFQLHFFEKVSISSRSEDCHLDLERKDICDWCTFVKSTKSVNRIIVSVNEVIFEYFAIFSLQEITNSPRRFSIFLMETLDTIHFEHFSSIC